jgi:hypothetical protein
VDIKIGKEMKHSMKIGNLLNVFISSKDMLRQERDAVEKVIHSLNMNPIRTEVDKWFATPDHEAYLKEINKSNIVVLIVDLAAKFDNSDKYYHFVKKEINRAFALGKSVLAFFKNTNGKDREKVDDFINDVQHKLFAHVFKDTNDLSEAVKESILNELFRKYVHRPTLLSSSKNIYMETCSSIDKCKYRLYLSQQTPTILLGPRNGRDYEKELYKKIKNFITVNKKNKNVEIVFLYDKDKTEAELENSIDKYDITAIKSNVQFFKSIFDKHPGINLQIIARTSDIVQFVIVDNYFLFGNHSPDTALAVLDENPVVVSEMVKEIDKKTSNDKSSGLSSFIELYDKRQEEKSLQI